MHSSGKTFVSCTYAAEGTENQAACRIRYQFAHTCNMHRALPLTSFKVTAIDMRLPVALHVSSCMCAEVGLNPSELHL